MSNFGAVGSEVLVVGNHFYQVLYDCQFEKVKHGICSCLETRGVYRGKLTQVLASFEVKNDDTMVPVLTTPDMENKLREKLEKCFCSNCLPQYPSP